MRTVADLAVHHAAASVSQVAYVAQWGMFPTIAWLRENVSTP